MCIMVYIAADRDLPIIGWDEDRPRFHVVPLPASLEAVRRQFSQKHVYFVGTHEGCGCAFGYGDGPMWASDEATQHDLLDRLRTYLEYVTTEGEVVLYTCWSGDEAEPARHLSRVGPHYFGGEGFALNERELLIVMPQPVEAAT